LCVAAREKLVVDYLVKKKYLVPPSTLPYNLSSSSDPKQLKAAPLMGLIRNFGKALPFDPEVCNIYENTTT